MSTELEEVHTRIDDLERDLRAELAAFRRESEAPLETFETRATEALKNGLDRVRDAVERLAATKADQSDVDELRRRIA